MPRRSQKKQTRLAFAPAATSAGDGNEAQDERFARLSYGHPSMATVRPGNPGKPKESLKSSAKSSKSPRSSERKSPDLPQDPTQERQSGSIYPRVIVEIPLNSSSAKAQASKQNDGDESSDDDIVIPTSHRKRRLPPQTEEKVASPIKTSAKPSRRSKPPLRSSTSHNAAVGELQDDTPKPLRRLKRKAASSPVVLSDSDDSEEPVLSSPPKRRRRIIDSESPETPPGNAHQHNLDIEEDLKDLEDSVVKKSRTRGRLAESARDKRLKHLEALRRRRAGEKEQDESEYDSDCASGNIEDESEDDSDGSPTRLRDTADNDDSDAESAIASNEDLDRYEDDFVLEDENTELGVPTEEIPFEFTRHAYKQPKEYFRDVVGWMVHNRLDPAFPRSDPMYEMAFMKLEDEVRGRAGSQLISSVWNADFVRALLARPDMELTSFPVEFNHSCDACRRSGHPASTDMKLYGKPYSLKTLEPLADESDDGQSDDSEVDEAEKESIDRDRDGHILPDQEKRFCLGRKCKDNAQLAHTLTHWRYHLNEWVVDYLERMGQMDDSEVLRRNNMSQKRKTRNAIHVIEEMVEAGEIDKLWRDFHLNLKSAREKSALG